MLRHGVTPYQRLTNDSSLVSHARYLIPSMSPHFSRHSSNHKDARQGTGSCKCDRIMAMITWLLYPVIDMCPPPLISSFIAVTCAMLLVPCLCKRCRYSNKQTTAPAIKALLHKKIQEKKISDWIASELQYGHVVFPVYFHANQ